MIIGYDISEVNTLEELCM